MKTCARGHEYRGDENYRARSGRCPVCFNAVQLKYNRSPKGLAHQRKYNHSEKGAERTARYEQSPKGWLDALRNRRRQALKRRAVRPPIEEAQP